MNRGDADELGHKIKHTWHGGPSADIWAEELEPLHTGQARIAYEKLRRSEESAPSIAKFHAVYNSLTIRDDKRHECDICDGGGWQEVIEHGPACNGTDECHCSAVRPCRCTAGRERQAAFDRIQASRKHDHHEPGAAA